MKTKYVLYLGGTPRYYKTAKGRNIAFKKVKGYKKTGNQGRENYKKYAWRVDFKPVQRNGLFGKYWAEEIIHPVNKKVSK